MRMTHALTELAAVIEEEVRVGEELLRNLAAQREAILSWDSSALFERTEEKEVLIRGLGAMEERRQGIMTHLCRSPGKNPSLREFLAQLPPEPQMAAQDRPFDSAQEGMASLSSSKITRWLPLWREEGKGRWSAQERRPR